MQIIEVNNKVISDILLYLPSVGKLAYTSFIFASTTAVLPMNRGIRGVSVSV